jgi:hypothetical protein
MMWHFGCLVFLSLSIDGSVGDGDGGCDVRIVVAVVRLICSSSEYLYILIYILTHLLANTISPLSVGL